YIRLLEAEQNGNLASLRAAKASRAANLNNIDWLMEHMSLSEKVTHMNTGPAGKRGIQQEYDAKYDLPAFAAYDGPRGVKQSGKGIVSFPSGPAVAASWDVSLANEVGKAFSDQLHQYKGNQIYAPGLNIIKHPLAGRNGEYYSEDPLLTGKIAAAVVQGIQTNGCLATPKHFVCNSYETGRFCTDVTVSERVLREIYLPAFQIVVEEGHPWSLMTAYNSVNGHFMSANRNLLDILYNEWNFQGYVVSDYKADMESAAAALDAGCNVEMPGWTWYNKNAIEQAIHSNTNVAQRFDGVVRKILEIKTSDWIARPEKMKEMPVDLAAQQALSRRAGAEGSVLLKNSRALLPLPAGKSIALIGPFGNSSLVRGDQGSGTCRTKNLVTLLDALKQSCGDQVTFAEGCSPETGEEEGALTEFSCTAEYFGNMDLIGTPVMVRKEENIQKLSFTGGKSAEIATGVFSNAFQFNGQSLLKAGQIPATAENSDFTWSFRVYLPDQFPRPDAGLISGELAGTNRFVFTPSFFEMSFPSETGAIRIPYQLSGQIWCHVALVRRAGQATVYVDGSAVGSAPFRGAVPAIPLSIGGDILNKKYANCLIDDIRCYDRALTESELKSAAQKNEIAGPVFHQSCDDLSSIADQTDSYSFLPDLNAFSARWTAVFVPQKSGKYEFKVFSNGGVRFILDKEVLYDQWQEAWVEGMMRRVWLDLEKDHEYRMEIEFSNWFAKNHGKGGFIKLSYALPDDAAAEAVRSAAQLAAARDVAIVAVGVPQDPFQGEANDRESFVLPGYQDELIRAVAAANTNTIVALFTSGGVDMRRWIDDVPAVMEMFFPGEEAGHCFTDLLYGRVNPSGRLPVSYPKSLNQLAVECVQPVFETSVTGVGYRHFDRVGEEPLFPFGYGLSYTTYEFRTLKVNGTKDPDYPASASVTVQNTGKCFGKEVVQVYVSAVDPKEEQPVRELGGFAKVDLKPGETKTVGIPLHSTAFSYYDSSAGRWAPEAKRFIIYAGGSSRDLPLSVEFGKD
ncbi:MAG: glycoside hydrolase family 3 C-terminal domain-containing protein, partial [Kiritimatiellales bacterium]